MTENSQSINLDRFSLAYRLRRSGNGDTLVLIHGFGSHKEHFRHAFTSHPLRDFTLITVDLIGFGQSRGPKDFTFSMCDQASIILELLDNLQIDSFHLCGHSMGGLVVMNMAELAPGRILSLIDLEGNLTPEDCFLSGKVAELSFAEFIADGRNNLERGFRAAAVKDPAMHEYADSFAAADSIALYKSAQHTVQDSSLPLVEKLTRLSNTCYIYGERNRGIYPAEKLLHAAGVPVYYVQDAGHSMAVENPGQLFSTIREFIENVR